MSTLERPGMVADRPLQRAPGAALRPWVERVWSGETQGNAVAASERVLPTGAMHLAFRIGGPPVQLIDGACTGLGHAVVGGARARAYQRDCGGRWISVGAMLRPGAAGALFGAPAVRLAHRHTALVDLWGPFADQALDRLAAATRHALRLQVLEALLAERLQPARSDLAFSLPAALARLDRGDRIATVAAASGCSHRHFTRCFEQAVGLRPKVYARVRRFQRLLAAATAAPTARWTPLALDAGYADLAAMGREFQALSGLTASAWRRLARASPLQVPTESSRAPQR